MDEIFKSFNDVVFDELEIIKYDSLITLKHVTSGRYLSSYDINYQTGSHRKWYLLAKNIIIQMLYGS
ncbi:hypothetical protein C1645_793988 [Glomus cerebriforme]|uniref:MIR domain-containing protein n=1 Tax=Glomus cerebriforme TaxID=658196 RepID=A0A397S134_9GLOM|nr:hypothetical protein C1645_793988 [Glomus cerebriforme]